MKRKLALLMAFMMAATLVPAQPAFAGTTNKISNVATVTGDTTTTTPGMTVAGDTVNAPYLYLEADKAAPSITGKFELHLPENAEWAVDYNNTAVSHGGTGTGANHWTIVGGGYFKVTKATKRVLTLEPSGAISSVTLPLAVKLNGAAEGAVEVTVVPLNSTVTGGKHTFATVAGGSVMASVDTKATIARTGNGDVTLVFRENTPSSFKTGETIKLRLPKGFTWGTVSKQTGGTAAVQPDARDLVVTPTVTPTAATSQDTVYVTVAVRASRDAAINTDIDVTIDTRLDVSPSSLVVGKYVEYGVNVKAEKVLDVLAGRNVAGKYKAKLIVDEPVASSLAANRYIEFKFVDENGKDVNASLQDGQSLKLSNKSGNMNVAVDAGSIKTTGTGTGTGVLGNYASYTVDTEKTATKDAVKADKFDLYVTSPTGGLAPTATKFEVEVPFVVASNYTGKLFLQVKGAGIQEQLVQIADVKPLVTVEVTKPLPQVKVGLQNQAVSDIVIKETEAGALDERTYSIVEDENLGIRIQSAKLGKVEGNIVVDEVGKNSGRTGIEIKIDRKSTTASTITITGVTATLDRTVAYGVAKYKANFGEFGTTHDLTDNVGSFEYITTVTPIDDTKRMTTVFKIGESSYTQVVGNETQTVDMGVAAVAEGGRTLLPVRFVANALGATLVYDNATSSATFIKGATVAKVTIGSDVMTLNGTQVKLERKPLIVDGRMLLAVRDVALAFGLGDSLAWNPTTNEVTILPQDATAEERAAALGQN